jgi:hypothetical protein
VYPIASSEQTTVGCVLCDSSRPRVASKWARTQNPDPPHAKTLSFRPEQDSSIVLRSGETSGETINSYIGTTTISGALSKFFIINALACATAAIMIYYRRTAIPISSGSAAQLSLRYDGQVNAIGDIVDKRPQVALAIPR